MRKMFEGVGKWIMFLNVTLPALGIMLFLSGHSDVLVSESSALFIGGMSVVFLLGWWRVLAAYWGASKGLLSFRYLKRTGIISSTLVTLGLIGTVLGFMLALQDVDFANTSVSNSAEMIKLINTLAKGMGLALQTTLVGALGSLHININLVLLTIMKEDSE